MGERSAAALAPETAPQARRRPRRVTWLAAGFVLEGARELLGSLQYADQARNAGGVFPAPELVWLRLSAGVFGVAGLTLLAAAAGLVLWRRWGWRLGVAAPPLIVAAEWGLRLAFSRASAERASRPLDAVLTLLALALVYAVLWWPSVRRALGS